MGRRIGSGKHVSILNDAGLVTDYNPYRFTVNRSLEEKNVSSLFKKGSKEWNEDIVKDVFDVRDVEIILGKFL